MRLSVATSAASASMTTPPISARGRSAALVPRPGSRSRWSAAFTPLVLLLFVLSLHLHLHLDLAFAASTETETHSHDERNRLERWRGLIGSGLGLGVRFSDTYVVQVNETRVYHGDRVQVFWRNKDLKQVEDGRRSSRSKATSTRSRIGVSESAKYDLALFSGLDFARSPDTAIPIKWKEVSERDKEEGFLVAEVLLMSNKPLYFVLVERRYRRDEETGEDLAVETSILGVSSPVLFHDYNYPVGVHLAAGYNTGDLVVQWNTFSLEKDSSSSSYGYLPEVVLDDGSTFEGETTTYTSSDLCGSPANTTGWLSPGLIHTVYIPASALVPSRTYEYHVGSKSKGMRGPFTFTSAPSDYDEDVKVNLFAIADMGEYPDDGFNDMNAEISTQPSLVVAKMMIGDYEASVNENDAYKEEQQQDSSSSSSPHWLLVHNGDISYSRGYGAIWHSFFHMVEPLASRMPYMTTIGNHERDFPDSGDRYGGTDSQGECGVPYMARLPMPRRQGPDKPWYVFEYGPLHFLQMSTEHSFEAGSDQYAFVVSDLEKVDRKRTPWLIVGFHRPLYIDSMFAGPGNSSDQGVARELRDTYEEMFHRYEVDMTWVGHHHSYQRTCSVFKGECVEPNEDGTLSAPIHVVLGHAGAGLCNNLETKTPHYFEVVELEHGYTRVEATRKELKMTSINTEGHTIDTFTLKPRRTSTTASASTI